MYKLWIPGHLTVMCNTLIQARDAFIKERDDSDEGASTFPDGEVLRLVDNSTYTISYNGRVWLGGLGGTEVIL